MHREQAVQGTGHLEHVVRFVFFASGGVQSQAPQGRQPWAQHAWSPDIEMAKKAAKLSSQVTHMGKQPLYCEEMLRDPGKGNSQNEDVTK